MKTKQFELRNSKGEYLDSLQAINSFHAVVKYINNVFDSGKMLTEDLKPMYVDDDLLTDVVNIESMVNGLYNFR